jgi:DNA invertase Pin-like site-specific DNA recombinase
MNCQRHPEVRVSHLARDAYLYIRQATRGHVFQQTKSLPQQFHLQQQALALGWPAERVIVIDSDIGHSGASAADRPGFQELLRQVRRGCVGIVVALEPSRLARNLIGWRRLVDACARHHTLLLVQGRVYDPADSHDRVLLGCDRTMPVRKTVEWTTQLKEALA